MNWKSFAQHIEVREGARKTSYRVNYRRGKVSLRDVIPGDWSSPAEMNKRERDKLERKVQEMIYEASHGRPKTPAAFVRNEDLAEQLIQEAESQDEATYDGKRRIFRKHLIAWLNDHYPHASDLTVETWPKYKAFKRAADPTIALENHVKYFRMLRKRAFELGLIKQLFPVKFDLKKEEFREAGQVITAAEEALILKHANRTWRDRSVLQRDTGMRPGEVRKLKKTRVAFETRGGQRIAVVSLVAQETKTHRDRSFEVHSERAVEVLWRRACEGDSPYFFPMETDPERPMDKHLNGWKSCLRRANEEAQKSGGSVNQTLTPHDWRHTYADEMFKKTSPADWASLCFQLDMSLETAQGTYIHFKTSDTRGVAALVARERRTA